MNDFIEISNTLIRKKIIKIIQKKEYCPLISSIKNFSICVSIEEREEPFEFFFDTEEERNKLYDKIIAQLNK